MAITYSNRTYGPYPWQRLLFGTSGSGGTLPAFVYVPGGGWGMRDPVLITDTSIGGAEPVVAGALANPSSSLNETYRIFVVQIASTSHNGFAVLGISDWVSGTSYTQDDLVVRSGVRYRCITTHTASGGNAPDVGGGATYWLAIAGNDCSNPRIANRGDGSPAYGMQGVSDVQRAIGWIRQHAAELGVNPDKIALMGSSAGGQAAGCAAYMDQGPFGGTDHPSIVHPFKAKGFTTPNALVLQITPTRLDLYVTSSLVAQQGIFFAFMQSMYGRPELGDFAGWTALPLTYKRALDPYWAAKRSGFAVPTYLDYGGSKFDDKTSTQVYNGEAGSPGLVPDAHHALNGWTIFDPLSRASSAGGYGQNGKSIMFMSNGVSEQYRRYTTYAAGGGTAGVHYSVENITSANYKKTHGEDIVNWLNTMMA